MRAIVAAAVQVAPSARPLDADVVEGNTAHALELVERCVEATGAELVVVPEAVTTGYAPGCTAEALWDLTSAMPGAATDAAAGLAARLGIHLVWAAYERGAERGVVYNSSAVIGPEGAVRAVYRKTHLYLLERRDAGGWATAGDDVVVVDTDLGRIGTVICFDGDYPELCRIQAVRGAEIVVRPSAFLRSADIWELTTRARAYDNHVYVVAANAVGSDPGGSLYFGNSMIVGPTAGVLARATSQEGWIAARLDPDPLRVISPGSNVPQIFDHLADRNVRLYARHRDALEAEARSPFPNSAPR